MVAPSTELQSVLAEDVRPGIRLLTLNRPDRLNAMDHQLVSELHARFDEVAADPDLRCVIITGAGRGFCAGLDLKGSASVPGTEDQGRPQRGLATQQHIATLIPHLRSLRVPVIAAVNGPAAGGGFALALGADVRVCSTSARFNVAFVKLGLSGCDIGVSWLLPRLVGAGRAFELLLTGRLIDAAEAGDLGLVTRVVEDGVVVDAALEIADQVAANSPFGVWMTKEVMWSQLEIPSLQAGIDLENRTQILSSLTEDSAEAMRAFVEKRTPEFRNR
jgi:enoyl-CoA hydratase